MSAAGSDLTGSTAVDVDMEVAVLTALAQGLSLSSTSIEAAIMHSGGNIKEASEVRMACTCRDSILTLASSNCRI